VAARAVLALDQGTTSSRALVIDRDGRILAVAQREFPQHFPQPGWVEHDPEDLWGTQRDTAIEALREAGMAAGDVAAVGITNQRETAIVWERATGRPIHRAIVWQDRRTADACAALEDAGAGDAVRATTGLRLDPYFSATKIAWILDRVPGARVRAEAGDLAFGTVDSWLVWRLTAGRAHVTDATNASRTSLYDLRRGRWDDAMLATFGVPRAMLPEVRGSSEAVGTCAAPREIAGVPIAGIAGDQHAALFGQACFRAGMAKNTYGTGCFLLLHTGDRPAFSDHGLLTTVAWRLGDRTEYALEGSVFVGGAAVQWLRDGLGLIAASGDVERLAASVPDTGGVVLVPAFTGLGAPYWDPHARGALLGITRGTTAAHVARAALEAIAFQSHDLLVAMAGDAGAPVAELRVDGGATANGLLLQLQADVSGVPVVRPAVTETTALGAAFLAGLAVGFWRDRAEIEGLWREDARFEPRADRDAMRSRLSDWARAVERARGWARTDGDRA